MVVCTADVAGGADGPVTYSVEAGIAVITINRPQARNALNHEVRAGLFDAFRHFDDDTDAAVMVLTGAGSAFCAGADLKELGRTRLGVPPPDFIPQIGRNVDVGKPVVGAINGACRGGGFLLAQNCDLLVAAANATFAISEVKVGRGAPWAAPLPRLMPPAVAMQMLLTGDPIDAERAREVGFINLVVPTDETLVAARRLAEVVRDGAPLAVTAARRMVHEVVRGDMGERFSRAEEIWRSAYESRDAQEGVRAFIERRQPLWSRR